MLVSKNQVLARNVALASALVGLALAPACKKEGGDGAGGSKAAASALGYMPKTASVVMGINVSSAANAKVLSKYRDQLMSQAPKEFNELQEICGLDFMKDINSIVVGVSDDEKGIIVVNGNFTRAKVEECLTKAAAKDGKAVTMADDGKLRVYTNEGKGETIYAHWPSDNTVVMSSDELGGKATLEAVLAGDKLSDGPVMSLVNSTKQSSTMWMAGDPSKLAKGSPLDGQELTGMALTINAGDTLDVKVLANFPSDAKAKELVAQAKMMLEMGKNHPMAAPFKSIIEKFKLEADGKAIKAGVSLTTEDIDKIATMAQQMGGMLR